MSSAPSRQKRPREEEDGVDKENDRRGAAAAVPSTRKPLTVPRPFRAARGVAASHRQDAAKNTIPTALQHTPASSTRTSDTNSEKPAGARRVAPHRQPSAVTRTHAPPAAATTAGPTPGTGESSSSPAAPSELEETWRVKRRLLESAIDELTMSNKQLEEDHTRMHDVIESLLVTHETDLQHIRDAVAADAAAHEEALKALEDRENRCRALKSRSLEEVESLQQRVAQIKEEKERVQELTVLEHETIASTRQALADAQEEVSAARARLAQGQQQEEMMKDASYGLSGEVKDMVLEMETLQKKRQEYGVAGMELEVTRRELYSRCEELKGSIRVYCRVKGDARRARDTHMAVLAAADDERYPPEAPDSTRSTATTSMSDTAQGSPDDASVAPDEVDTNGAEDEAGSVREPSLASSVATTAATSETRGASRRAAQPGSTPFDKSSNRLAEASSSRRRLGLPSRGALAVPSSSSSTIGGAPSELADAADPVFTFEGTAEDFGVDPASPVPPPLSSESLSKAAASTVPAEPTRARVAAPPASLHRTIHVHSVRANATSTGRQTSSESFTFDRVFDGRASQAEVYHEMEPLVHSAVDGYAVCVFAYGQTGSGKTYTMEGHMQPPELMGAIPRALETIFARQEALAKEGCVYELSCYFVEIYNDSIRDLLQSPSVYESGGAGYGNNHFHAVKHSENKTSITNVRERRIGSMEEFRKIHRQATQNRRTAKTQLNERSSRSHSIFTLHITGTNSTIGQKSEGVLCLVDLAGSERVNESGVHGQQFKEAVSINRSLLDLGKCISAMRSGGSAVAPWRNSKLTYLLQHYLGAKGGKMLMLVNVSNERRHLPESVNALRFATRVSETVVGTSVKRVTHL